MNRSRILPSLQYQVETLRPSEEDFSYYQDTPGHRGWRTERQRDATLQMNNYMAKLFGSRSRAYAYGPHLKSVTWCDTALKAIEKAYLAGAADAIRQMEEK